MTLFILFGLMNEQEYLLILMENYHIQNYWISYTINQVLYLFYSLLIGKS